MRDKLVDLLSTEVECNSQGFGDCSMCDHHYADKGCMRHISEITADFMLSNGVMVFPVKPGDTVYTVAGKTIKEWKVYFVGINSQGDIKFTIADKGLLNSLEMWNYNIGEYVFLTEEDAINELKERRYCDQR